MFFKQPINKLNFLLPTSDCLLCHGAVRAHSERAIIICEHCHDKLPLLDQCCPVCALPVPSHQGLACGECLKNTPVFSQTLAAFHYEPPISDFITRLKFNNQRQLIPLLCESLIARIERHYQNSARPQQLIPVPLHPKKLRQRGFNQAQLLANRLAKKLTIPLLPNAVSRCRETSAQINLDAIERQRNLKDAFQINQPVKAHVAIIDDVMTTGTTVSELSKALLNAGTTRVDVWCIARAYAV